MVFPLPGYRIILARSKTKIYLYSVMYLNNWILCGCINIAQLNSTNANFLTKPPTEQYLESSSLDDIDHYYCIVTI